MDEFIFYILLLLTKWFLWMVELITDLLFGYTFTSGTRSEREEAKKYEKSAQLVNVKWRARPVDLMHCRLEHFLYIHEKYIDPRYVLKHAYVTLLTVEKDCAIFCVSDPGVNVYDTKLYPFVFLAHYMVAKKLVIIPLESFNHLADEIGDPKVNVSLVHMTLRCGSTLISQITTRVLNTRTVSEPEAMARLSECYSRRYYTWETYRKLVQSSMRLRCKVEPHSGVERIVIKMSPNTSGLHEMLHEMFPDFNVIFNTRHPRKAVPSFMKVLYSVNNGLYAKTGLLWNFRAYSLPYPFKEKYRRIFKNINKWIKPMSYEESFAYVIAGSFASFLEAKHVYKYVVVYENLVADPDAEVERMFKAMNIPRRFKAEAMKAFEIDSQYKKFGERGETIELDDNLWKKIDAIFEKFSTGLSRDMSMEEFEELLDLPNK